MKPYIAQLTKMKAKFKDQIERRDLLYSRSSPTWKQGEKAVRHIERTNCIHEAIENIDFTIENLKEFIEI